MGALDVSTAVAEQQAARIAAISLQRLRYWQKTNLISPDVERVISERNTVRLFSLARVVELVVASELRRQDVSLQHIRKVINHLADQGYEAPLRQVKFAISGGRLLFQHDDGEWEDSKHPYQGVMWQVIDLEEIRARVRSRLKRSDGDRGIVEKRRKVQASKPVFAGTRVPLSAITEYIARGKTTAEILKAFPSLTHEDVEAARQNATSVA